MKKVLKCSECKHLIDNTCSLKHYENGERYVICSINHFNGKLQIKTAPRWCPLKRGKTC